MEEQLSQATPEEHAFDTFRESVFVGVMGPDNRGRVRCMGSGPCPSEVFGSRYGGIDSSHDMERMRGEMRNEICHELRGELRDEIHEELWEEIRDEIRNELRDELREEFNVLLMSQMRAMETRLRENGSIPSAFIPVTDASTKENVQPACRPATAYATVQNVQPRGPHAPATILQATSSNPRAEVGEEADVAGKH